MDMTHKPVLQLHICAGFDVQIAAARKCRYEEISLEFLAGNAVIVRNGASGPVHLHGVPGLVSYAHGCLRNTRPVTVFVTELRAHVGLLTVSIGAFAILIPKQSDGHAFLGQFAVNVLVIDDCIRSSETVTLAVKQLIKHFVGHVIIERPRYVQFLSTVKNRFDSLMRAVDVCFDASLAEPLKMHLQDLSIVRHKSEPPVIQVTHCCVL